MKSRSNVLAALLGLAALSLAVPSRAQVTTGTIVGTVQEASGAVIPGASVTVTNTEKGTALAFETDQNGSYLRALSHSRHLRSEGREGGVPRRGAVRHCPPSRPAGQGRFHPEPRAGNA